MTSYFHCNRNNTATQRSRRVVSAWVFFSIVFGSSASIAQPLNGFNLEGSSIPADQILPGGPPRDGIPALTNPRMIPANEATYLKRKDVVMGVYHRGIARAYPNRIMVWHEIVNDDFDGTPVAVTFCPLCNTGIAFLGEVDKQVLNFGVSGLLYNSDMLMFDRQTESLWSQLPGKAISGKYQGRQLERIPVVHTTWEDWQKQHPQTLVLSTDTGYRRDYKAGSPYGDYEDSRTLFFPVMHRDKSYHPKENILGLHSEGTARAWPFKELKKTSGEIEDEFDGKPVRIVYDKDSKSARAYDANGEMLPAVTAFWFAWFTFFPYTEVYKAPGK